MKGRIRRRLLFAVPILVGGFLSFKLFEVVLVYNWGWERVPAERYPVTTVHAPGWEDVGAEADAWLEDARAELETPALSAAVSVDGELVWAGAAGYADIDSRTPVSPDTMFRVGSSSKAVTAMAMGVSHFVVYPEYGVVVSILMNRNQGSFGEEPAALVNMFLSVVSD